MTETQCQSPIVSLETRVVRYADLKPCFSAFIDSRTPGSDRKENFTIIGPGVSENPEQFVHICDAHGFNIGAARQPPGCVNSQHSHDTAEVFVVHSGEWRFDFGEHGEDAQVYAGPGDVLSFPVHVFRGFANIGKNSEPGFLWAVLGGDDPGRVTWAPKVFELAVEHGLVLLENGALIDTAAGEQVPPDACVMPPTTEATVAALRRLTPEEAEQAIARTADIAGPGERLVIGANALLDPVGGFTLSRVELAPGDEVVGRPAAPEVLFMHRGDAEVSVGDEAVVLGEGDTMTMPLGLLRRFATQTGAVMFVVRGFGAN